MNVRSVILAFLASRYPGAYSPEAITQRVNKSGMLDKPATLDEALDELRVLANRFKAVEPDVDKISGAAYWTATQTGVEQWHLDGSTHVS